MFELTVPLWEIVLRTIVVYFTVLLLLRVAGKRELGQMSVIDFVVILVIANAVQNSMNGGDNSLIGGTRRRGDARRHEPCCRPRRSAPAIRGPILRAEPTSSCRTARSSRRNMDREHIERDEIAMAAREHARSDLAWRRMAILEPDGSISIIPRERGRWHRSRRGRATVPPAGLTM